MNLALRKIKTFADILSFKGQPNITGNSVMIYKDNRELLEEPFIKGEVTNIGFRIAYFLWILRGANTIQSLNYYSNHMKIKSDDDLTLRGAYGPRIRNWIGADQLEEAIKKNLDVDNPEDFAKPKGVDQLQRVVEDLGNGLPISNITIFNPAIDFDMSNDIPDIITIIFHKDNENKLNMNVIYMETELDGNFVNDYFVFNIIHRMIASVTGIGIGVLSFMITRVKFSVLDLEIEQIPGKKILIPTEKSTEKMWKDLFLLYGFEKHLRCNINEESINHPDVDIKFCCDKLYKQFLNKIDSVFWKELGLVLMAWALDHFDEKGTYEDCLNNVKRMAMTNLMDMI